MSRKRIENPSVRTEAEKRMNRHPDEVLTEPEKALKKLIQELLSNQTNLEIENEKLLRKEREARALAEEALEENQRFLHAIMNGIQDPVYVKDLESRIILANEALVRVAGKPIGEIVARADSEYFDDESMGLALREHDVKVMESGRGYSVEEEVPTSNGVRLFLSNKTPYRDASGEVAGIVGVSHDITDQKRAEASLRESEERYLRLLEASPEAVFIMAADGAIVAANPAACRMFGMPEDELQRLGHRGLADHDDARMAATPGEREMTGVSGRESSYVRANGERFPVEVHSVILSCDPPRSFLILRDISEYKRMEDERETAENFLRLLNESTSKEGLVEAVVRFFHEKSGCEAVGIRLKQGEDYPYFEARGFPGEFRRAENSLCAKDSTGPGMCDELGRPVLECMCGNVIQGRFDASKPFFSEKGSFWTNSSTELLATTTEDERQSRTRNRCNREGYESVALIPLRIGESTLGLVQLNDRKRGRFTPQLITLWERLAGYLSVTLAKVETEQALRSSLSEKEVLLREIHHRVKNNLAAVVGLLDLQRQSLREADPAFVMRNLANRIKSMALVHERLYRSDNLSRIDFEDYLKGLLSHIRVSLGLTHLIESKIESSGTEMALDIAVPCGMIVNELVSNAFEHAFPGGAPRPGEGKCIVTVSAKSEGDSYTLVVADNGVGLPSDLQWEKTRSLGLRLVRMLGRHQLGGTIELDNTAGSTFTLTFGKRK